MKSVTDNKEFGGWKLQLKLRYQLKRVNFFPKNQRLKPVDRDLQTCRLDI